MAKSKQSARANASRANASRGGRQYAKQNKRARQKLGAGGVLALVLAGVILVAILGGVVYYVHSGKAGVGESTGMIASSSTVATESDSKAVDEVTDSDGNVVTGQGQISAEDVVREAESRSRKAAQTPKNSPEGASAGKIVFKNTVTANQLGTYFTTDVNSFRKVYDGKTVTVTGKLSSKSSKMLYVELSTGTKVPMRVYLSNEEQREQFSDLENGTSITVRGNVGVVLPEKMDNGGFQEMANGMIALDTVTLVK